MEGFQAGGALTGFTLNKISLLVFEDGIRQKGEKKEGKASP